MPNWPWTQGIWVYKILDPLCDLGLGSHPWSWPWIFKANFELGISQVWEGRLTMNERAVSRIGCWNRCGWSFVSILTQHWILGISMSNLKFFVFQEQMDPLKRPKNFILLIDRMVVTPRDLIHGLDLWFPRLNFENNYTWGITPANSKCFYH